MREDRDDWTDVIKTFKVEKHCQHEHEDHEHDHEDHETSDNVDLSNMTLWKYGKGFLLEPTTSCDHYGEKYFHNGWWMSTQKGWFFKAEYYDWLITHGVHVSVEDELEHVEDEAEIEHVEEDEVADFSSMTLRQYGKGYLLMPPKSSQLYGEKYLCEDEIGWWMPKQRGWFFKAEYYDWLLNCGVKLGTKTTKSSKSSKTTKSSKTSKTTKTSTNEDLSKMSLEEYGRGYILKTAESDPLYGQKYFMKGFWNTKQHGWFFQSKYYEDLISMGAKYIKQESDCEEEPITLSSSITHDNFEYVHSDSEFVEESGLAMPKFIKYGKGWILKADSNYTFNGNKYYEGGFWIPSIKGWFFKTDQKKKFMTQYFDI